MILAEGKSLSLLVLKYPLAASNYLVSDISAFILCEAIDYLINLTILLAFIKTTLSYPEAVLPGLYIYPVLTAILVSFFDVWYVLNPF